MQSRQTFYAINPDAVGPDSDYEWGDPVATLDQDHLALDQVLPGDIIQMRDVETSGRQGFSADHHTVVVQQGACRLCIWQQNASGKL